MLPLATGLVFSCSTYQTVGGQSTRYSSVMLPSGGEVSAGRCCLNNSTHAYLMHGKEVVEDTL